MSDETLAFWDRLTEDIETGRFRCRSDNVLVAIDGYQGDTMRGGLIVAPGNIKRQVAQALLGRVVSVGPGHYPEIRTLPERKDNRGGWGTSFTLSGGLIPTTVKVGDRVILESQLAGESWPLRSGEHRLVREAEILAVLEYEDDDDLLELGGPLLSDTEPAPAPETGDEP